MQMSSSGMLDLLAGNSDPAGLDYKGLSVTREKQREITWSFQRVRSPGDEQVHPSCNICLVPEIR
jgi:hypothetical protein